MAMVLGVGGVYPGALPEAEGAVLALDSVGSYRVLVHISNPTSYEIGAFRNPWQFGIYARPDLPGGLPLVRLQDHMGMKPWILEMPFNVQRELAGRPDAVALRLGGASLDAQKGLVPALNGSLVDAATGKVCRLKYIGPPLGWVQRLDELWRLQVERQHDYDAAYHCLIEKKESACLWDLAEKF